MDVGRLWGWKSILVGGGKGWTGGSWYVGIGQKEWPGCSQTRFCSVFRVSLQGRVGNGFGVPFHLIPKGVGVLFPLLLSVLLCCVPCPFSPLQPPLPIIINSPASPFHSICSHSSSHLYPYIKIKTPRWAKEHRRNVGMWESIPTP